MAVKVMCINCKYARVDDSASIGTWKAYECGNAESEYHRCLLNIGINGETHKKIVWQGCISGRRKSNG